MREIGVLCALLLALLVTGCGGGSTTGGGGSCTAGQQIACECRGNVDGVQVCKNDGKYGPCDCGEHPADVTEGDDVPGGTDSGDTGEQTGFCSPACSEGSCCDGKCVDLGNDETNCGTCGKQCPDGQTCVAGECLNCTPDCTDKECGDDGCGGSCGTCTGDEVCQVTQCEPCVPSCDAKACGDDGCGGSCGVCTDPAVCVNGNCTTDCVPNCSGLLCGDPDGCGEKCDGACPGGGSCSNGVCVGDCKPSCVGKECGNDGCGGQCGACGWPETCGPGGQCLCTPLCSMEGRECGPDGCGGSCGTCAGSSVCADASSPVPKPTFLCLDMGTGCSDGNREGFLNEGVYPDIASCAGAFPTQSLRTTRTGAWCGNSLGACDVAEDLCAPGWHICMRNGWPGDLTDRMTPEDCNSANAGNAWFVAASSVAVGEKNCTTPLPCNHLDPVCCGLPCNLPYGNYDDCVWPNSTPVTVGGTPTDHACKAFGSVDRGVLCCEDPPVVGH